MSIFQRSHKWKIRFGYLIVFYSALSLYNQEKKISKDCVVSTAHQCLVDHRTFKESLAGIVVGLLLLAYGYIRRHFAKKKSGVLAKL